MRSQPTAWMRNLCVSTGPETIATSSLHDSSRASSGAARSISTKYETRGMVRAVSILVAASRSKQMRLTPMRTTPLALALPNETDMSSSCLSIASAIAGDQRHQNRQSSPDGVDYPICQRSRQAVAEAPRYFAIASLLGRGALQGLKSARQRMQTFARKCGLTGVFSPHGLRYRYPSKSAPKPPSSRAVCPANPTSGRRPRPCPAVDGQRHARTLRADNWFSRLPNCGKWTETARSKPIAGYRVALPKTGRTRETATEWQAERS